MLRNILKSLILILPVAAGLIYWNTLPDKVVHRFSPIRISDGPENVKQEEVVSFRGKKYVFSFRFLEKDEDLKGEDGLALRADNWSKKVWWKPHFLDENGNSIRVLQRVQEKDGKMNMVPLGMTEQIRHASSGKYIESKWHLYEDLPEVLVPVIELGRQKTRK